MEREISEFEKTLYDTTGSLYCLRAIAKEYPAILVDTSAILKYLSDEYDSPKDISERILKSKGERECVNFFLSNLEKGMNFYTTLNVLDELLFDGQLSKKEIKQYSAKGKIEALELNREWKATADSKRQLKKKLEDGKIVILSEKEKNLHDFFRSNFFDLKNKYALSDADYELIINGAVISKSRTPCAILSNDSGIWSLWHILLKRDDSYLGRFDMFGRVGVDLFQKIVHV